MRKKPDEGVRIYSAGVFAKHLQALSVEIDGVRQAEDIECIHRMRVASRRMRSALDLFKTCIPADRQIEWLKAIQKITHALGAARDLDVQIDLVSNFSKGLTLASHRPGVQRLQLRLTQQREEQQLKVLAALDAFVASQVIPKMLKRFSAEALQQESVYLYSPALYQLGFDANITLLDQLLSYDSIVDHPEDITGLHAMRIAAKKARYALEAFAPLYENELKGPLAALRKIQDGLGDVHDCDVWLAFLPEFIEQETLRTQAYYGQGTPMKRLLPGLLFFNQDRHETRERRYVEFTQDWAKYKEQGLWLELKRQLQVPAGTLPKTETPLLIDAS